MRKIFSLFFLFFVSLAVADEDVSAFKGIFQPLPVVHADAAKIDAATATKVELGKKLYFETALSAAGDLSCNSCHDLKTYGVDNKPVSEGHKKQKGNRNSPTVYNASLHIAQFWDGRAKDVEEQALGPIMNPVEMAMASNDQVIERLKKMPAYVDVFKKAFPKEANPLTFANIGKAIGAFERTLLTPSRFDDFLRGKDDALTAAEKKGMKTFVETGCTTCHMGVTVGGLMFQKLGLVKPYETADLGRYEVTKNDADKFVFKVPSLRNIEKTGPYFHDGSVKTLEEAILLMGRHQLGRELSSEQVKEIHAFLGALTGPLPAEFTK